MSLPAWGLRGVCPASGGSVTADRLPVGLKPQGFNLVSMDGFQAVWAGSSRLGPGPNIYVMCVCMCVCSTLSASPSPGHFYSPEPVYAFFMSLLRAGHQRTSVW
ncbi:hypothetical protein VULLAG_LOCUS20934 [Vulpes lagopus]